MVANTAEVVGARPDAGAFARFADRWIYVFMAGLFVVTALAGFVPRSLIKLAAVEAGQRPPFPPILHVHAVLMRRRRLRWIHRSTVNNSTVPVFLSQHDFVGYVPVDYWT